MASINTVKSRVPCPFRKTTRSLRHRGVLLSFGRSRWSPATGSARYPWCPRRPVQRRRIRESAKMLSSRHNRASLPARLRHAVPIPKLSWTRASESSSFYRRATKCRRRPSVEYRGISFSVVEMSFPRGWKWTVGKAKTVTVGVCATRLDAIRQAQTFIDAVIDWAA